MRGRLALVVADKLRGGQAVGERGPHVVEGAPGVAVGARAGALALLGHAGVEGVHVDGAAGRLADLAREVDREAVGVVKPEGHVAGEGGALVELLELLREALLAGVERGAEALLLGADDAVDERAALHDRRVVLAHELADLLHVGAEELALDAHEAAVVDRAAQEAPQHVASALVAGKDAVANHERDGAGVVGHDAQRAVACGVGAVGVAREALADADQALQQVAVVVGGLVLHDGRDALEAHAGVDVAVRKLGRTA